jgi:hypothetical protein
LSAIWAIVPAAALEDKQLMTHLSMSVPQTVKENKWIKQAYRWAAPVLGLWLAAWILLSWAGVQDDALIHLRYADNLVRTHLITYDGVHPNYGASSLLYVYLLAFLHTFTASTNLPRLVSSFAHLLLAAGLLVLFFKSIPRESSLARLLGLILIVVLVSPSAVRWLDDGMETGLALCFVTVLCWVTFRQSVRSTGTRSQYLALVAVGFFTVLLRTELILLCSLAFALLARKQLFAPGQGSPTDHRLRALLSGSHLLVGGLLALALIRFKMHYFLPDTALAKSDGVSNWLVTFFVTGKIFAGALSFGAGLFFLWLLTIFLAVRAGRFSITTLLANLAFPALFSLAASRGQQIQGARYFAWTLFFSILWNIFELSGVPDDHRAQSQNNRLAFCFLALLVLAMPFESSMMYPMLRDRSALLKEFEASHFESLEGKRGIAYDIGFIGYFSRADICDLAGLVNGRDKARETTQERLVGCLASHPDFMFVDLSGIRYAAEYLPRQLPIDDWQICSRYDYKTVKQNDPHYLVVPRSVATEVCRNVANTVPSDIPPLLH